MFELTGKVAVVTGAASGIGRAVAERFTAAGATVVLADLADATELAASLGGRYVRTDVAREQEVEALMASAAEIRGSIDVCVNNAGITVDETPLPETTRDELQRAIDVNVAGVLFGLKHAPGHMTTGGAIVNTASLAALVGFPAYGSYAASKAAIVSLTRTAAIELGEAGIRVNCICPSSVDTPMLAAQPAGELEAAATARAAPLATIISPEQAAALIHFLAADDCPVISGQAINIDGGISAGISVGMLTALAAGL
jgi:NAD(P)-dependent dehydrogenase (short-subunit alcohol dehydrogenase family)